MRTRHLLALLSALALLLGVGCEDGEPDDDAADDDDIADDDDDDATDDDDTGDDDDDVTDDDDDDTGDDDDDTMGPVDIHFAVDSSTDVQEISRFIYGNNSTDWDGELEHLTFTRFGGNRTTAYNWENNASNAGSDWYFHNDGYLGGGDTPGEAVRPDIQDAHDHDASIVVTLPIQGYVAADKDGTNVYDTPNHLEERFKQSVAFKGSAFTLTPDVNDDYVYQDEFVNWVDYNFPGAPNDPLRTIFYCMDNEPGLWASTHSEVHPDPVTYTELMGLNIEYAAAVKSVVPSAQVFGFVAYGWGAYTDLQGAPDAGQYGDFIEYYLDQAAAAEADQGQRLIDVLDLHYYSEARGDDIRIIDDNNSPGVVAARVQAPRSLWDPTYTETSWITQWSTYGPIELLPRLDQKIAAHYPGTRVAITEYNFGGYGHISGGIAQADVLGIFGRDQIFAAALWEMNNDASFHHGAFDIYRNYDGNGGAFGDTSISATTDDVEATSIYASVDDGDDDRMVLVVINKTDAAQVAGISVQHGVAFSRAEAYQLTSASSNPVQAADVTVSGNQLTYSMPAMSVTTLVLLP